MWEKSSEQNYPVTRRGSYVAGKPALVPLQKRHAKELHLTWLLGKSTVSLDLNMPCYYFSEKNMFYYFIIIIFNHKNSYSMYLWKLMAGKTWFSRVWEKLQYVVPWGMVTIQANTLSLGNTEATYIYVRWRVRELGYNVDKNIKAPRKSSSQKHLLMHFRSKLDWITSGTSEVTNTQPSNKSDTISTFKHKKITESTHLPQRICNIGKGNRRSLDQILIRWS